MKSYKKIVFSALAAFCFPVFARGAQELIPATSWVYDAVSLISIEAGIVNFSDSTPVTIAELKSYLNEIDREKLSKAGKKQYDRIFEYFDEKGLGLESSLLSLTAEPSVNLEGLFATISLTLYAMIICLLSFLNVILNIYKDFQLFRL